MKALFLSRMTAVLAVLFLLSSQAFATSYDREPYLTKNFRVNVPANVNVETSGGSISVKGGSGDQIVVRMFVSKSGFSWFSSDDIEESLEDYDINISQQGNTVYATAEKKGSGWGSNSVNISFELEVPRSVSTDLNTSGGSISLQSVEGNQKVRTSGGSLNFDDVNGYTEANTSGGSINISNYQGVMHGKTSGGSIRTNNSDGEFDLYTSGGSIILEDVHGSIEARTSGGSIKAFVLGIDEYLTLKTSGGSVSAVIPEDIGVDLDLSGNRVNTTLNNFSGESTKNRVKGAMNGGGAEVKLHTSGGSVNLDYHRIQARY